MLKLIISGAGGRMGHAVADICETDDKIQVVAGFDITQSVKFPAPIYADPLEYTGSADVLVDFSNPEALSSLLSYCVKKKMPLVLCTTGYSPEDDQKIAEAAKMIPIFKSGNMSLGINLLADLIKKAVHILGAEFDIEIIERHHSKKLDAPSGTAFMLADAAKDALPYTPEYVFDRSDIRKERDKREIGMSVVRGGTIVGEHEVIFAGLDEIVELRHTALSRNVFANGAVAAAKFLSNTSTPGLYSMNHIVSK